MTIEREIQFLAGTLRPFVNNKYYPGNIEGEELIEWFATEVEPMYTEQETGNMVANPYADEPGEPATIDDSYLLEIADQNTVNRKAVIIRYDIVRLIAQLRQLQAGLDGARTKIRKFLVLPF